MPKGLPRKYQSAVRQRQAEATRRAIAAAARKLIFSEGYDAAKIDAIAREAGVATQTVYAVFGSKQGILAELLDQDSFGPDYQELIRQVKQTIDPEEKLRFPAKIARQIYDSQSSSFDRFRGAGVVAPDLAELERERECHRYEAQKKIITFVKQAGRLRKGLSESQARDVLWTLTSREVYRMLVRERGWSSQAYENWVAEMLVAALMEEETTASRTPSERSPR
jgi:AcrR family transcriptional regulator